MTHKIMDNKIIVYRINHKVNLLKMIGEDKMILFNSKKLYKIYASKHNRYMKCNYHKIYKNK